jgi:hypothetical protein
MTSLQKAPTEFPAQLLFGFIAGFLATLVFHQLTLALLWGAGVAPFGPFPMAPIWPFGVPAVFSLAFWGGVWGILFAFICNRFPRGAAYWIVSFLFGAILPSLVALLIVLPLKGKPVGGGWHPPLLLTAFLINGAWGIGTALILGALARTGRKG